MDAHKKPTCSKLVYDYLLALDDLATLEMIQKGSGAFRHNIPRTLTDLCRAGAADYVVDKGQEWWFATPATDRRNRTISQIRDDIKRPRRGRCINKTAQGDDVANA